MALAAMYASDGQTVLDAGAPVLWGESEAWDSTIVGCRQRMRTCYNVLELTLPAWTLGTTDDLGAPAWFYVSHVTDLRSRVHALQDALGITRSVWTTPAIIARFNSDEEEQTPTGFTDVRDVRLINEIYDALDDLESRLNLALPAPVNARVEVLTVEVGS